MNAIINELTLKNLTEVSARGGSRGGTVALLMAERDKRVKRAVGVAFPTDLISLTESHQNDKTYHAQFLEALKSGKQSIAQTRMKMIASSPIYFCEDLPPTQVHLAAKDTRVPVKQGDRLEAKMNELGKRSLLQYYIYPDRTHDDIAKDNTEMESRIQAFLSGL